MGCSDLGEDAWILSQFERDFAGFAAEVGAYDGQTGSTTLALEHAGWKTLAIEPNPDLEPSLKQHRSLYRMCACGDANYVADFHIHLDGPAGYSNLTKQFPHPKWQPSPDAKWETIKVTVRKLDSLLEEVAFPSLDALSIDTEGTEMDVLRGFTLSKWKPKVVVIESWDENGVVVQHMADHGYDRVDRRNVNDLFVRRDWKP